MEFSLESRMARYWTQTITLFTVSQFIIIKPPISFSNIMSLEKYGEGQLKLTITKNMGNRLTVMQVLSLWEISEWISPAKLSITV